MRLTFEFTSRVQSKYHHRDKLPGICQLRVMFLLLLRILLVGPPRASVAMMFRPVCGPRKLAESSPQRLQGCSSPSTYSTSPHPADSGTSTAVSVSADTTVPFVLRLVVDVSHSASLQTTSFTRRSRCSIRHPSSRRFYCQHGAQHEREVGPRAPSHLELRCTCPASSPALHAALHIDIVLSIHMLLAVSSASESIKM